MKKLRMIKRNFKFFLPLIFKSYPIIIVFIIIGALISSLSSFLWLVMPAKIIEELMGNKDVEVLIKIVVTLVASDFLIRTVRFTISVISDY